MSKIIVGIDDPERSKDAVALAAQLARASGAGLEAVCAYPYDDRAVRGASSGYRAYLREDAEERIAKACAGIADLPPVNPHTVADPSPARGIEHTVVHYGSSMIVIASSHRGGVGRVLAGTVAERLLHGAPCPVAVAPKAYHEHVTPIETIGVAYNGSEESKAALTGAVTMARTLHARLKVISVLDTMLYGTPAMMAGPGFIAVPDDLRRRGLDDLIEVVASLPDDVEAEPLSLEGDPESRLAEETKNVDLMITGSRGYGPHRAVLLGSVSGRLVRDAACPVIVLPRSIEAPLEALFGAASDTQAV